MNVIKRLLSMFIEIWKNKRLLQDLVKSDFKQRYLGSFLGITWAFIQPTVTILIFWFVFQVGFKAQPIDDFPFILWLVAGMIPWFFFSDAISTSTNSVIENSYLVKKVVFRVSLLPIIKLISALGIHLFFILFMLCMYAIYGYGVSIYWLQIVYYLFAMLILVLGISWVTSSLVVFLKDIGQFVGMALQFGFWLTPIFWSIKTVPEQYVWLIELNPVYYIIEGYRNSLINNTWFWQDMNATLYFWAVTIIILVVGGLTFKKLKPHFADVL